MKINPKKIENMDLEIEMLELALANVVELIPLIANAGEKVDPVILRSYGGGSKV